MDRVKESETPSRASEWISISRAGLESPQHWQHCIFELTFWSFCSLCCQYNHSHSRPDHFETLQVSSTTNNPLSSCLHTSLRTHLHPRLRFLPCIQIRTTPNAREKLMLSSITRSLRTSRLHLPFQACRRSRPRYGRQGGCSPKYVLYHVFHLCRSAQT